MTRGAARPQRAAAALRSPLAALAALAALSLARAQSFDCSTLGCPYDCDAASGCFDACARRVPPWTLAAQLSSDTYDATCTARDVRAAARDVLARARLTRHPNPPRPSNARRR